MNLLSSRRRIHAKPRGLVRRAAASLLGPFAWVLAVLPIASLSRHDDRRAVWNSGRPVIGPGGWTSRRALSGCASHLTLRLLRNRALEAPEVIDEFTALERRHAVRVVAVVHLCWLPG
jgi:hypothetical protein